jgi:ribosomal protein L11 methylase PrmA
VQRSATEPPAATKVAWCALVARVCRSDGSCDAPVRVRAPKDPRLAADLTRLPHSFWASIQWNRGTRFAAVAIDSEHNGRTQVFQGVDIRPHWRVLPPTVQPEVQDVPEGAALLRIHPTSAFGDGTHETTQLCLLGLGYFLRTGFRPKTVLDFGAGSGILAIAAAQSGARVEAVEVDEGALVSARRNALLNGVQALIDFRRELSDPPRPFELVLANILRPVLVDYGAALCARQARDGKMILSGLLATDVPEVLACFGPLLNPMQAQVYERHEWRAVVFESCHR